MSMISSLIDELRKSADEWNGSSMFELARMCSDAADTITELRGALQVASVDYRHLQDENARLRSCLSDDAENARMIMAENAKLRELVRVFYHCTTSGECDECPINGGSTVHLMPDTICGTIHERMRGLGVEVE